MADSNNDAPAGDRLAKVIARAGLCSRRDAEEWIKAGRITVNGAVIRTPAFNVAAGDSIKVDGQPLASRSGTRLWLYHKPAGLVVTEKDPEGRPTIFEKVAEAGLPRVLTVGRLDLNTEGLLLLTNDGGLKRVLELPATGWLRRYRVRAFGSITQEQLDRLSGGVEIDGVKYGPIEATLERQQGSNVWLVVALREGKNREVKNVLASLGLQVNRLIRVSFGPFQLGDLAPGAIEVVKARVLRDQLGDKLAREAHVDFESDMPEASPVARVARAVADPSRRAGPPGRDAPARRPRDGERPRPAAPRGEQRARPAGARDVRPVRHRPGRPDLAPPRKPKPERAEGPVRRILFDDGREEEFRPAVPRGKPRDEGAEKPSDASPEKRGPRPGGPRPGKPASRFGPRAPRRDEDGPRKGGPARAARPPGGPRPPRRDGEKVERGERPQGPPGSAARPQRKSFGPRAGEAPRATGRPARAPARSGPARGPRPGAPPRGPAGPRPQRPGGGPRPGSGPRPGGGRPPRKPRG